MRAAEPVFNVELRQDRQGHASVVFAFPYRAEIVDAVRAIPGRRFDWEAREWWAPRADATAPVRQGRAGALPVAARSSATSTPGSAAAVAGWVGRVTAGRLDGEGAFVLDTIAGELDEPLASQATDRGGRLWLPFTSEVADACSTPRARAWTRARCAARAAAGPPGARARVAVADRERRRAALQARRQLGSRTIPAFTALPARRGARPLDPGRPVPARAARALPAHVRRRGRAGRRASARAPAPRPRRARSRTSAARARTTAPRSTIEDRLGGELRPFQRAGVAYVLVARRAFLADEQGLGKTVQALAALEADDAYPAVVVCPASLKLNWRARDRELAAAPLASRSSPARAAPSPARRHRRSSTTRSSTRTARGSRCARREALVLDESHYVKNPRAKRTQAVRGSPSALAAGRAAARRSPARR